MIDYAKTRQGDILRIVGQGAPGYARLGDLVRVLSVSPNGVTVEDRHGESCEFVFNCGAERLEPTEWTDDFPSEGQTIRVEPGYVLPTKSEPDLPRNWD